MRNLFSIIFVSTLLAVSAAGQRIAVISPASSPAAENAATAVRTAISDRFRVLDASMTDSAFRSAELSNPFNMERGEARLVGSVVGCEKFILVQAETPRRTSLEKDGYFEAWAAIFIVSSLSGRMYAWQLFSAEGPTPASAQELLRKKIETSQLTGRVNGSPPPEPQDFPDVPEENEENTERSFRPPMPFKRIKPRYTDIAYLYGVKATVDVAVNIDTDGRIVSADIQRWAGFGLDEAVLAAIREMNWRPAERGGRTLPMRVLLRYNFTNIDKER